MTARNWVHDIPTPEAAVINRVLYDVQHDPEKEARFLADRQAFCADFPLSDAARAALVGTDIGQLYALGSNPYLLRAYALQLRVPEPEYLGALRALLKDQADG